MVPDNAGVIRSQTLPEFAFRLQDLEEIFELETFVDDPLYSPFLLKRFQKERKEKEGERLATRERSLGRGGRFVGALEKSMRLLIRIQVLC